MKTDIHPDYFETNVTCSCGNEFTTHSTVEGELHVELCSQCHPFYTGKQKLVDTGGRVERFKKRYAGFDKAKAQADAKAAEATAEAEAKVKAAEAKAEAKAKAAEKKAEAAEETAEAEAVPEPAPEA